MSRSFPLLIVSSCAATFGGVLLLPAPVPPTILAPPPAAPVAQIYYPGCNEVRQAGKAPLYEGQPGYRRGMDGDGDGIACEDYH